MHVVLDARYIAQRQSGVGHYTQRLITGLADDRPRNRYTCVVARDGPGLPVRRPNIAGRGRPACPSRTTFGGDLWLLGYLPLRACARLGTDVYHGPAVFLPL